MTEHKYLAPRNAFTVDGSAVICDGDDVNKVSGTSMAGIIGCSPWSTPFIAACNLLALAREDISNRPSVKTGVALEEKIIRYAGRVYKKYGDFFTAEEVFQKREGDHDSWESDFQDDVFAGHVDGIVTRDGEDYILEIKTTKDDHLDAWAEGVPEYYYLQVALYNHFITHQDKAYVVLGIVNDNTYRDPASWVPNENTVVCFEMPIDQRAFAETLDRVRAWYGDFITARRTPEATDDPRDQEMLAHLKGISADITEFQTMLDRLAQVSAQVDAHDVVITALRTEEQELRDRIKDYMVCHDLSDVQSASGDYRGTLTTTVRKSFAEERMVADGVDPARYKTQTETKTFRLAPVKKAKTEQE